MAKRPEDRFQTGDELVQAIEQIASDTNTMLSPSALGRMLKELFGQRPEPWIEIGLESERAPEGVTVTSEPIPPELALPVEASFDQELGGLPDLSAARVLPTPASVGSSSSASGSRPVIPTPASMAPASGG